MKILKYIFLLLLLVTVAAFVFIATQPGNYSIIKSKEIAVSKDIVANFITDYQTWNLWNPYFDKTASKELFSEDGKSYTIKNDNGSVIYQTLNQYKNDSIVQKLTQNNESHTLIWKFQPTKKGTLVSCIMKGNMTLKQKIFSVLQGGSQNYLGEELNDGLINIDNYLTTQLNNYSIKINGVVTKENTFYIKQIDSSSVKLYNTIAIHKIPSLLNFAKQNAINYTDKPFIIFDYWNKTSNNTKFSICLPVKEEIITSEESDTHGGEILEFKAVKVTLIGDYSHLRKAWDEGYKYLEKNKLTEDVNGSYIETYVVYPTNEKQPSKWVTEIYIPIKVAFVPKRRFVPSQSGATPIVEEVTTPTE